MNNFEPMTHNNPSNERIQEQKKDGGAIYENLKDAPAVLKTEEGRAACLVHIGYERKEQQDRVVFGPNGMASIDGMGGEGNLGGLAAQILAEEMQIGFAEGLSPEEIHQNAFARMEKENLERSGACYMAFKLTDRTLQAFSAGDVKIAVASQNGNLKYESLGEKVVTPSGQEYVTNAIQGIKAGVCRLHTPIEMEDRDRVFMGSDGFWNQFPGGAAEVNDLVKNLSAEMAVVTLNKIAMERMTNGEPDAYADNLNIIVYDFNATEGKGEPSPFTEIEPGKTVSENKEERVGIIARIKGWFEKGMAWLQEEKTEEFDWAKINIDPARRRRILASFENRADAWDHDLSYFGNSDPEQERKENDFINKIASGEINSREISHFLRGINAPIDEEENPLVPEKIFEDINKCKGENLSMPALISELAGTPDEPLTVESLGQFLLKYPEPTLIKKQMGEALMAHTEGKSPEDFEEWSKFIRATLWMVYGKRAKYAEQVELLYKEAEKHYPEIVNLQRMEEEESRTEETSDENFRNRIEGAQYRNEIQSIYIERMEEIFKELRSESNGHIDESILFDPRLYRKLESDDLRIRANNRFAEISGVHGSYRYDEDLRALAHVLYGMDADETKINYDKIERGPYSANI